MTGSRVSVVVPVHDAASTLRQCLEALSDQTDPNYEVIVVDDGSHDECVAISEGFGLKTIALPVNKGQGVARNAGARATTGDILAFVDSDVVVPVDWVAMYRQLLAKYPDAAMVCSGYGKSLVGTPAAAFELLECDFRRQNIPLYVESSTGSNCAIYRKDFEEAGGYPEYYMDGGRDNTYIKSVATNEDSEFGFLLTQRGGKIVWSHENPVAHFFRGSWRGYLKRQTTYARFSTISLFRFPGMLFSKDIYSGESITPQLLVLLGMGIGSIAVLGGPPGVGVAVLVEASGFVFFYLYHRSFLQFLRQRMRGYSFMRVFPVIVATRLYWLYGILLGLRDGCHMLWNNLSTRSIP